MVAKKQQKFNFWRFLFMLSFVLTVLFTGGVMAAFAVIGFKDMPVINTNVLTGDTSTVLVDMNENVIARLGSDERLPVKIKQVPDLVKNAFLATEDVRYYQHHGVDFRAIARAAWVNLTGGEVREGGSTITQQLVKISYLSPDRTFKRKIQEVILSVQLERQYTKDEIFEMYLNRVYLGAGAYGIQSACKIYYNKTMNQLTLAETALLAGLPQAPSAYSPVQNPTAALERRQVVLDNMLKYGMIDEISCLMAKNEEMKLNYTPPKQTYQYPFFVDYVTDKLIEKYGEADVFKGGLTVYVTIDRQIQQIAEKAMANKNNYPNTVTGKNGTAQPQSAAVFLDPHTGYIKAIVGGREHTQARQLNRATQMRRQPGSTFKPIIAYGPSVEYKNLKPSSIVYDKPTTYGNWSPSNDSGYYSGAVSLRTALAKSINMVAVDLLHDLTVPLAVNFARSLGVRSLDDYDTGLGIALGGLHRGVTPLELAGAYGAFANHGISVEPTAILKVKRADGSVLEEIKPTSNRVMKQKTAETMTDMLQSVVENGTGTAAAMERPVAGKTGTTDDNKDIWFVGYTPELLGAVWIGYDQPKEMPHAYGGTYPARMWKQIMSKALTGVTVKQFPGTRAQDSVYVQKSDESDASSNNDEGDNSKDETEFDETVLIPDTNSGNKTDKNDTDNDSKNKPKTPVVDIVPGDSKEPDNNGGAVTEPNDNKTPIVPTVDTESIVPTTSGKTD